MSELTEFIEQRLGLPGCRIVEGEQKVQVFTPDIYEDVSIVKIKDNKELERLSDLLDGRELVQETDLVVPGKRCIFVEIGTLRL